MTTTQRIARQALIFSTLFVAAALAVAWYLDELALFPWWAYVVLWVVAFGYWYRSGVRDAAIENLANLR